LNQAWSATDHIVYAGLVVLLAGLAAYAVAPGAMQELSPRPAGVTTRVVMPVAQFEIAVGPIRLPHETARAGGAWWFFIALAVAGGLGLMESAFRWRAALLVITLWCALPLVASYWESHVAAASALRWGLAIGLFVSSLLLWMRHWVPWERLLGLAHWNVCAGGHASICRRTVLGLAFLPLLAMGLFVLAAAMWRVELTSVAGGALPPILAWTCAALLLTGILHAVNERVAVGASPTSASRSRASFRSRLIAGLGLLLGVGPILVWLLYAIVAALREHPLTGPDPESEFHSMGLAISYGGPLVIMTLALVGTAIRERSQGYAFAGGAMLLLAVTAAFLLMLRPWGMELDRVAWIRLAQINALVAALFGIAWQTMRRVIPREQRRAPLLVAFLGFGSFLCAVHLATPIVALFLAPSSPNFAADSSHWAGWASVVFTIAAVAWFTTGGRGERLRTQAGPLMTAVLLGAAALVTQGVAT